MTELEGAILGVLRRGGAMSAYAVRQVFLVSQSDEWSGSAGAVYPAIARLQKAKLVAAAAQKADGRGTKALTPTRAGLAAHDDWLCDVVRAAGPGSDPFRTRAPSWSKLPAAQRRTLIAALIEEMERQRAAVRANTLDDSGDAVIQELNLALLDTRLNWLKRQR